MGPEDPLHGTADHGLLAARIVCVETAPKGPCRHMSYSLSSLKRGLCGGLYRGVFWGLLRGILGV